MRGTNLNITAVDATISDVTSDGYCRYTTDNSSGRVYYQYTIDKDGFLCIHLDLSKRNDFSVYLNGNELYSESISLPQMLAVSQVEVGDVVEIAIACNANDTGTAQVLAALMNENVFWSGYDKLSQSTLELTSFSTTAVDGTILCNRDGLLYTSIPQNGNWYVYVDGQPVQAQLVGNAMVAVPLTKGYHEVAFRYHNDAFALGWKVTAASTAVLLGLYFWIYPARNKKGKYAK